MAKHKLCVDGRKADAEQLVQKCKYTLQNYARGYNVNLQRLCGNLLCSIVNPIHPTYGVGRHVTGNRSFEMVVFAETISNSNTRFASTRII